MYTYTTCADIDSDTRDQYMKNKKRYSYKKAVAFIKENLPSLYKKIQLQYYNP